MKLHAPVILWSLVFLVAPGAQARTWHVPVHCPTIQSGVDSASAGDTVLVAPGTYIDCTHLDPYGGLNCVILKSGVCLRSDPARAGDTVIDAQNLGRCVFCENVDAAAVLEGLTFTRGTATGTWPASNGGGVFCSQSSPVIRDCVFAANTATYGAGLSCETASSLTVAGCVFVDNTAVVGGGMFSEASAPLVTGTLFSSNGATAHGGAVAGRFNAAPSFANCTLHGNWTGTTSGVIFSNSGSAIDLSHTIVASSTQGSAAYCGAPNASVSLSHCDLFGNAGGDWVGCIADQSATAGNFSEDPRFCDAGIGDFRISYWSPCAPWSTGAGLIGAYGVGCRGYTVERLDGGHGAGEEIPRTDVGAAEDASPAVLTLGPAVPNPFNPSTEIAYTIPASGLGSRVVVDVHDVMGRRVRRLVDSDQGAGTHRILWDGMDESGAPVASGVYFYRVLWGGQSETGRMVLLR